MSRAVILVALAAALTGCQTANGKDWAGTGIKPYRQAEKSCLDQTKFVTVEDNRRDFFVGCMAALGWTPKPGATIDL